MRAAHTLQIAALRERIEEVEEEARRVEAREEGAVEAMRRRVDKAERNEEMLRQEVMYLNPRL